jgi:hypothetical protein
MENTAAFAILYDGWLLAQNRVTTQAFNSVMTSVGPDPKTGKKWSLPPITSDVTRGRRMS